MNDAKAPKQGKTFQLGRASSVTAGVANCVYVQICKIGAGDVYLMPDMSLRIVSAGNAVPMEGKLAGAFIARFNRKSDPEGIFDALDSGIESLCPSYVEIPPEARPGDIEAHRSPLDNVVEHEGKCGTIRSIAASLGLNPDTVRTRLSSRPFLSMSSLFKPVRVGPCGPSVKFGARRPDTPRISLFALQNRI